MALQLTYTATTHGHTTTQSHAHTHTHTHTHTLTLSHTHTHTHSGTPWHSCNSLHAQDNRPHRDPRALLLVGRPQPARGAPGGGGACSGWPEVCRCVRVYVCVCVRLRVQAQMHTHYVYNWPVAMHAVGVCVCVCVCASTNALITLCVQLAMHAVESWATRRGGALMPRMG